MMHISTALALLTALSGCGLIDSNIADVDLSLPPREFTVDTDQWSIQAEGDVVPAIDCSASPAICTFSGTDQNMSLCSAASDESASVQCFGSCNLAGQACEATVLVELWTTVDLAAERPELSRFDSQPLVDLSIRSVTFEITENTMNVDAPAFEVFVAPSTVMSGAVAQALKVGVIPAIAAGMQVPATTIEVSEQGQESLKTFMRDFATPFNIILRATTEVEPGDPVPEGRMKATFQVDATAGI